VLVGAFSYAGAVNGSKEIISRRDAHFSVEFLAGRVQDVGESEKHASDMGGGRTMRWAITIAVLVLIGVQAQAGTITTGARFQFALHGAMGSTNYDPFNPALGPLNAVQTTISVLGVGPSYLLTNPTSSAITFLAGTDFELFSMGGFYDAKASYLLTLGPGQSTDVTTFISLSTVSNTTALFSNLDGFLGTTPASLPGITGANSGVFPTNSAIRSVMDPSFAFSFSGNVSVTYYYGSTLLLPEPGSVVLLSLGLAAVAGLAWRRHRASLAVA
jgi:hypothetical protein